MGTFDIYTRSFWDGNFEWAKTGNVPASGSINCVHFLDPYLVKDNELDSIELHIHQEDVLITYTRESISDEWELGLCDSLEYASA